MLKVRGLNEVRNTNIQSRISDSTLHQGLRILQQQFFDGSESEYISCEVALHYAEPSESLSPGSPGQAALSKVIQG